jgi:hypothetical protein
LVPLFYEKQNAMPIFIILLIAFLFFGCQNNNQTAIVSKVDAIEAEHFPFQYYKKHHGDSVFPEAIIQNEAVVSFASITHFLLPYKATSKQLLKDRFLIRPYDQMPTFPFFAPDDWTRYGIQKFAVG